MVETKDLYWAAGLFEGDGCFSIQKHSCPMASVDMTDYDVVKKIADLLHGKLSGPHIRKSQVRSINGQKPIWSARWYGSKAVGLMMTLYSMLGQRRQGRIKEILDEWKSTRTFVRRDALSRKCQKHHKHSFACVAQ